MKSFKVFEKTYSINLSTNKTNYSFIGDEKYKLNRLKHLIYQIEQDGSPLKGEKISEILLGAINLNVMDLSYPFVDLKVVEPIKGVSKNNELISVKTSRDKHDLKNAVTYVNGFKIDQLIQFGMKKMKIELYKNKIFKGRNAMKLSTVISNYQKNIKRLFGNNLEIYTSAFVDTLKIFNVLKEYLEDIDPIFNKPLLNAVMMMVAASYIDKKHNTNYIDDIGDRYSSEKLSFSVLSKKLEKVKSEIKSLFLNKNIDNIDSDFDDLNISYCILFFDKDNGKDIVLNLHKTRSLPFQELFNNSMKIWISKRYHERSLTNFKNNKRKQNLYLKYEDVVEAFGGGDAFETHIKVEIGANWEYKERSEDIKKLYVKVIDKIKGIENNEKQEEVLKLLNKHLNNVNSTNDVYLKKFKEFLEEND